ncbi:endoplasmic reticulum junction formation protein lunapark-A-like [Amphibalanus amphitrite]|uniref:endoplasmic reticulum junction formation protein lunapark-A-like n=1 Tax=Amphibalanus amphitrite TaxID=1232801 RepID=UPI001C910A0A|nr:endoplasmic reticulum junction formation protein lunapark-A-like [Amphibalanus amphitrite]XP_043245744.1 endoplasmic reticulum junction formation protein lunapark-A-like [Amphibalanus amphitrite]XP_043245745.1 endoplasmic reticulum junction formation protein lunapark-A-like [Amphibalanus amphitrite]XP_043245746.1 endoplasmic reticulum junction formation protein lunapark-A-like [Amphibalanus amphitrite]
MGIIFSRFRRKQSTIEVLQQIEDDMAAIEEYKTGTRRRQQRVSAVIVAYSVVLYVAAGVLLYYHYFPDDMTTRLLCVGALLLFPAVVFLLKRLLMWYYGRKISKNELKLASLKKKKETILEEVQDKETYKVAKQILEKFAPEQLRRSPLRPTGSPSTPAQQTGSLAVARHRQLAASAAVARTPVPDTPLGRGAPQPGAGRYAPVGGLVAQSPLSGVPGRALQPQMGGPRAGPPLPRPVLPRERGIMDRMLDYLVGDGPANRYALICCQCQSHNGMALKEEFEYLAFRCSYCFAWNPARKQRPSAPRLPAAPTSGESMVESDTTETSESETEGERTSDRPTSEAEQPADRADESSAAPAERVEERTERAAAGSDPPDGAEGPPADRLAEAAAHRPGPESAPAEEPHTQPAESPGPESQGPAAESEGQSGPSVPMEAAAPVPPSDSTADEPSSSSQRADDQTQGSEEAAALGAGVADVPFADDCGSDP